MRLTCVILLTPLVGVRAEVAEARLSPQISDKPVQTLTAAAESGGSISGFFVSTAEGWIAHDARVPVQLGSQSIRIGRFLLDHPGGVLRLPVASQTGVARWYSGSGASERMIAHSIRFPDLYPGIDLVFRFEGNSLKSDYLVAAGADPAQIRFRYAGASRIELDRGDLVIDELRESAPVAWQERAGGKVPVRAGYRVDGDIVTFDLGEYDRSAPLVIDPYRVEWSRFAGGLLRQHATAIGTDPSGAIYVAGYSESGDVPDIPVGRGGGTDAFLMKLDPSQNRVLWATYLGGSLHDQATSLAVHPTGGVAVAGWTASTNFPSKAAVQNSLNGVADDAFLVRLDANGVLVFATYLGGSGVDRAHGVAATPAGDLWITGETDSANFPVMQPLPNITRGGFDAFATKFSAAGALLSSTFFGGSGKDGALAVATDSVGEAYVTGGTTSTDFRTTANGFQQAYGGGSDAFVVKIASDGGSFRYSSYLGGPPREATFAESGLSIAVDSTGSAWVGGRADSVQFPVVLPLHAWYLGGDTDGFLARISVAGQLVYSSYIGGEGSDEVTGVAILGDGSVALGGLTTSTDIPLLGSVNGPVGSSWDGFVMRVSDSGNALRFATYLSGSGSDSVRAVAASGASIWVAGDSDSPNFLASGAPRSMYDAWVAELRDTAVVTIGAPPEIEWTVSGTGCQPGSYTGTKTLSWVPGERGTVAMPNPQGGGTRRVMTGWADGALGSPREFIAVDGSWTANYRTDHYLMATAGTGGTITLTPAPAWVEHGTQVQVNAIPSPGYAFSGWSRVLTENPATVTMTAPLVVAASFECAYSLDKTEAAVQAAATVLDIAVGTAPECAWSPASQVAWISVSKTDTTARLSITANSQTTTRSGTVTIAGKTVTITQSGLSTAAVTFTVPAERSWTVTGANCQPGLYTGTRTLTWQQGAQCTVGMQSTETADTRHTFTGWTDGSTANPRVFTASGGTWTAVFRTEYKVTATAGAGGTASASPEWVVNGLQSQLKATPLQGYTFVSWSGGNTANPAMVIVDRPLSFSASFQCVFSLGSTSANVEQAGTLVQVPVTTGSGCSWSATPHVSWIVVTLTGGQARLSVLANPSTAARSGTVTIAGQTFTVNQSGVQSVAVSFSPPGEVTWTVTGSACQAGTYSGPKALAWTSGAQCVVTMGAVDGSDTRRLFAQWSDGSVANPRTFTAAAGSWSAAYRTEYRVQTASSAGGSTSPANAWAAAGSTIQVSAAPQPGFVFAGWSGGVSGNPATVTVSAPLTLTANFVCAVGLSSGSIAAGPGSSTHKIAVNSQCEWSATSSAPWISVTRSGAELVVTLTENTGGARSGTISVGPSTIGVTQGALVTVAAGFLVPPGRSWTVAGANCQPGSYTGPRTLTWPQGAQCTVAMQPVATTDTRHTFTGWTDGSTANPRTFTATGGSWTPAFQTEYKVTATAGNGGTVSASPEWAVAGGQSELRATASPGFAFVSWSGGNPANPAIVTVNQPLTFAATFHCSFVPGSTSATVEPGATVVQVGVTTGSGCSWSATSHVSWIAVTITAGQARLSISANPSATARSGQVTIAGHTFTVHQSGVQAVAASFTVPANVVWRVSGNGCQAGTHTGPKALSWTPGTQCVVTMDPVNGSDTRHQFAQWSDGSTANPRTFTAAAGTWSATYRTEHRVQTVSTLGGSTSPGTAWVAAGSAIQVSASPQAGYVFLGWSGGLSGNPASVTVNAPLTVTASFACSLTVSTGSITAGQGSSVHKVAVDSACGWSATTAASWISLTQSGSELVVKVAENTGGERSGTISIGMNTITVMQAAMCRVTPQVGSLRPQARGQAITIPFTVSPAGCSWSASSDASWAQVFPIGGSGNGSVSLNVFAHFGVTPRSGAVTIGDTSVSFYQTGASGTVNERIAGLMYYNFLGRTGSEHEIAFHASTLDKGLARKDLVFNFFNAEEFNMGGRFVAGLYVGLLDRDAEFGGWLFQRGAYVSSYVNQPTLVQNFLNTPEYKLKYGTPSDAEYVRLLYRQILLREASQEEVDFQARQLGQLTRVQLAMNFLNSLEFRNGTGPRLTSFLLYACILLRDADIADRAAMAEKVAAGVDMKQLIDSLLTSPDFQRLLD